MNRIKHWFVQKLIGNYFTEKEVSAVLSIMQYEMAQRVIGNRKGEKPVIPVEFWQENNGKYDTNFFTTYYGNSNNQDFFTAYYNKLNNQNEN